MVVLTCFDAPEEGVKHKEPNTSAYIGNRSLGNGTLYIAESRLSWVAQNATQENKGFSLEYPAISLHAISREQGSFHGPCLYLMVDGDLESDNNQSGQGDAGEPDTTDDVEKSTEVQFVPRDPEQLDLMFSAMSECQALHPDQTLSDLSEEEDEEYDEGVSSRFEDAEEEGEEYDVSAAEQMYGRHGPTHANGNLSVMNENGEALTEVECTNGGIPTQNAEPMDTAQFEDAPDQ